MTLEKLLGIIDGMTPDEKRKTSAMIDARRKEDDRERRKTGGQRK